MHGLKLITWVSLLLPTAIGATTIDSYLLEASEHAHVATLNSEARSDSWRSGWVDDAEFRVQYQEDEKNNSSETYRLRMRPKYGSEREAEYSVYSASSEQHWLQANKALSSDLLQRYQNIIEIFSLQFEAKYLQEKLSLLKTEIKAERSLSQSSDFNAEQLQSKVLAVDANTLQLQLVQQRVAMLRDNLKLTLTDEFSYAQLISPESIKVIIEQYRAALSNSKTMPVVKMAQLDKSLADARLKLLKSQKGFGVELLELKFEDKKNSAIGFTLGFRLPGGANVSSVERNLDTSAAELNYQTVSDNTEAVIRKKMTEINWAYSMWQSAQTASKKIKRLMKQPSRLQSPSLITGLRRQLLSINKSSDDTHIKLLNNYVELLHLSGLLSQHPLKNWLATGLPVLAAN